MIRIEFDTLCFEEVPLRFAPERYTNVFSSKNNKSLSDTLSHPRYQKLRPYVLEHYRAHLLEPLGTFLLDLKLSGDPFYQKFLNRYGDLEYSGFSIADSRFHPLRGIYVYRAQDSVQYIGRCRDSMKKRIDQGYGKIHPKNCFLDGQATNCHLNARITSLGDGITLWLHQMDDESEITRLEHELIQAYAPRWNLQK